MNESSPTRLPRITSCASTNCWSSSRPSSITRSSTDEDRTLMPPESFWTYTSLRKETSGGVHYASARGGSRMSDAHREIEEVLHSLRLGAAARRPPPETLTGAAGAGDVALTRAFLDGGADIEERSIGFASPL